MDRNKSELNEKAIIRNLELVDLYVEDITEYQNLSTSTIRTYVPDAKRAAKIFGEMGVIEDELRSASARAMNPTKIVAVTKKEFEAKANAADPFVKGVLRILSTRIREMNKANR